MRRRMPHSEAEEERRRREEMEEEEGINSTGNMQCESNIMRHAACALLYAQFTESPFVEAYFSIFRAPMNSPLTGNVNPGTWRKGGTKERTRTEVIEVGRQRQGENPNLVRN